MTRDEQFKNIHETAMCFLKYIVPVNISVKELGRAMHLTLAVFWYVHQFLSLIIK